MWLPGQGDVLGAPDSVGEGQTLLHRVPKELHNGRESLSDRTVLRS